MRHAPLLSFRLPDTRNQSFPMFNWGWRCWCRRDGRDQHCGAMAVHEILAVDLHHGVPSLVKTLWYASANTASPSTGLVSLSSRANLQAEQLIKSLGAHFPSATRSCRVTRRCQASLHFIHIQMHLSVKLGLKCPRLRHRPLRLAYASTVRPRRPAGRSDEGMRKVSHRRESRR